MAALVVPEALLPWEVELAIVLLDHLAKLSGIEAVLLAILL